MYLYLFNLPVAVINGSLNHSQAAPAIYYSAPYLSIVTTIDEETIEKVSKLNL